LATTWQLILFDLLRLSRAVGDASSGKLSTTISHPVS